MRSCCSVSASTRSVASPLRASASRCKAESLAVDDVREEVVGGREDRETESRAVRKEEDREGREEDREGEEI